MSDHMLIVTDPPHADVHVRQVANTLRLDQADVESKLRFGAPEILMSGTDDECRVAADALRKSGLRLRVVDGRRMVAVPWPSMATGLAIGADGLIAETPEGVVSIGWGEDVLGILCRPPADFVAPGPGATTPPSIGPEVSEVAQWRAILDIYFEKDGRLRRLLICEGLTDFGGLGPGAALHAREAVLEVSRVCLERFDHLALDTRFDGVRPRQRFRMGDESFDIDLRKAYSYGTLLLRQLLASLSKDLADIPQYEFASRLLYVLRNTE